MHVRTKRPTPARFLLRLINCEWGSNFRLRFSDSVSPPKYGIRLFDPNVPNQSSAIASELNPPGPDAPSIDPPFQSPPVNKTGRFPTRTRPRPICDGSHPKAVSPRRGNLRGRPSTASGDARTATPILPYRPCNAPPVRSGPFRICTSRLPIRSRSPRLRRSPSPARGPPIAGLFATRVIGYAGPSSEANSPCAIRGHRLPDRPVLRQALHVSAHHRSIFREPPGESCDALLTRAGYDCDRGNVASNPNDRALSKAATCHCRRRDRPSSFRETPPSNRPRYVPPSMGKAPPSQEESPLVSPMKLARSRHAKNVAGNTTGA